MADSTIFHSAFEGYNSEYKPQQLHQPNPSLATDFFSFNSNDITTPDLEAFENELDLISQEFDADALQLFSVDSSDAFSYLRSDTPTCGPPSTITVSSESAYDSSRSESFYNYPQSPYPASNYSFPLDLEMDFQRIRVDSVRDFANPLDPADPTSFGVLPPSPDRSHSRTRSSFSDYAPARRTSVSSDYYNKVNYATGAVGGTIAPSRVVGPISLPQADDEYKGGDPRKKYKCSACPRGTFPFRIFYYFTQFFLPAFARAYNLKTHMATHDPNRLKPHVCPHRSCGRSFSRKHDLGRHLISIHREESVCSSQLSATSKKSIGVDNAARSWCETCGKGMIGQNVSCSCNNVK